MVNRCHWPPVGGAPIINDVSVHRHPTILLVSPRYARETAAIFSEAGLPVRVGAVGEGDIGFAQFPVRLVVVDARGTLPAGLASIAELGPAVEARCSALLVLLSKGDVDATSDVYAAGATHVLVSPFTPTRLVEAARFALRMADRLANASSGLPAQVPSRRDELTGLATAGQTRKWLDAAISGGSDHDPAAVVLLVAPGRIGQINAAYGQPVADALLGAVAVRLARYTDPARGMVGTARLVGRLAGAEFAIALAGPVSLVDATRLAHRIVQAFDAPFVVEGRVIHLSCRVGIAAAGRDTADVDTLLRHASAALAQARLREPGAVEVFQPQQGGEPLAKLADLERDLRRAVEARELEILFQPQVEIATGRIAGVEALVRWRHPVLGELSAATLLEVAQSAEYAARVGAQIRRQALTEATAWPKELDALCLSLNVAATELDTNSFAAATIRMLAEAGFPAERLTLEITESDLIENLDNAAEILQGLRSRGISVALDDFGTGYSSLAYLKSLPLDALKVDKRLIDDLDGAPRDRVIVKGVVDMARGLGMRVVAEGVESEAQLRAVTAVRCDWYQGYLCAAPMPGAALIDFISDWQRRLAA